MVSYDVQVERIDVLGSRGYYCRRISVKRIGRMRPGITKQSISRNMKYVVFVPERSLLRGF